MRALFLVWPPLWDNIYSAAGIQCHVYLCIMPLCVSTPFKFVQQFAAITVFWTDHSAHCLQIPTLVIVAARPTGESGPSPIHGWLFAQTPWVLCWTNKVHCTPRAGRPRRAQRHVGRLLFQYDRDRCRMRLPRPRPPRPAQNVDRPCAIAVLTYVGDRGCFDHRDIRCGGGN